MLFKTFKHLLIGDQMKILVTGGAGFIGSHLVERLVKESHHVTVLDNLSSGKEEFIEEHLDRENFEFHRTDLLHSKIDGYFRDVDRVFHLAANSGVKIGAEDTKIDLEQNILVTYNVLEAMRRNGVEDIVFMSTSTVYGEADIPTPENHSPMEPISLYGATKLACESLISAYCHTFGMNAVIFRLANVIGGRSTHGVVHDFVNKLKENPDELEILGNGLQKKSYVYIDDCIDAVLLALEHARKPLDIFNIGSCDQITVKEIAEIVSEEMGVRPNFAFTGGKRGWNGDVTSMLLDISKMRKLGWKPRYGSGEAVRKAVRDLLGVFKIQRS